MCRLLIAILAGITLVSAWTTNVPSSASFRTTARRSTTTVLKALDYNDPVVAEEFANVQPMSYEEVAEELEQTGIRAPATMSEMDVKLMLVEMRLRLSGRLASSNKKERPKTFSSKFEEALWTKPAFEEFYNGLKAKGDHNAMNCVTEYLNNPVIANQRYGKDYKGLIREIEKALNAPPPVKSPTIKFSGFPANMGEMGCKMTLETFGEVVSFECKQDDDFPVLRGSVTYEDIESAKKAVAQYNGMDMGMGTTLELVSA